MERCFDRVVRIIVNKLVTSITLWGWLFYVTITYFVLMRYSFNAISILLCISVLVKPLFIIYENRKKIITTFRIVVSAISVLIAYFFLVLIAAGLGLILSGYKDLSLEQGYISLAKLSLRDFKAMCFAIAILIVLTFAYCYLVSCNKRIKNLLETMETSIVISSIISITFVFLVLNNKDTIHMMFELPEYSIVEALTLLNDGSSSSQIMNYFNNSVDLIVSFLAISISAYTLVMKLYVEKAKKESIERAGGKDENIPL